jgi:hypothetical protein
MEVGVIAETLADEGKTDLPPLPTQRGMCKWLKLHIHPSIGQWNV